MKKHYIMILDTESLVPKHKQFNQNNNIVYELAYSIIDLSGQVYCKKGFLISNSLPLLNDNDYYRNKLAIYNSLLANNVITIKTLKGVHSEFMKDLKEYNVIAICNHNVKFDKAVLNHTMSVYGLSGSFYPNNIKLYDTMLMSKDTIVNNKDYNYLTKKGRKSLTVENLYKYITNDNTFKESHVSYDDIDKQTVIFNKCIKSHKKMRRATV